jgi:hypothetical protein
VSSRPVTVLLALTALVVVAIALLALGVVRVPSAPSSSTDPGDLSGARLRVDYAVLPANDVAPGAADLAVVADIVRHRLATSRSRWAASPPAGTSSGRSS